ncbi:MAG: ECF transporter S component [Christensenella sp.]|nr:ECF transporter S component [Christensenella sp.]
MEQKTKKLTTTAVMAALVFIVTMLVYIPVPGVKGAYFNVGDVIIYCLSFILGGPYAVFAAAVGSALADLALGSAVYIPATLVIKGCMALIVGMMTLKSVSFKRYFIACLLASLVMAFGYCTYEFFLNGGFAAVAVTIVPNLLQAGCGVGIAAALYHPMLSLRRRFSLRPTVSY